MPAMTNIRVAGSLIEATQRIAPVLGGVTKTAITTHTNLTPGDYVELVVHQTRGGALNGEPQAHLGMVKLP